MKKHNIIDCMSYLKEDDELFREWEVTVDGKLWPCCHYMVKTVPDFTEELLEDDVLMKLHKNDPDWNNVTVKGMEVVINHPYYQNYCSPKGWNSENPPPLCKALCTNTRKNTDEELMLDTNKPITNITFKKEKT